MSGRTREEVLERLRSAVARQDEWEGIFGRSGANSARVEMERARARLIELTWVLEGFQG